MRATTDGVIARARLLERLIGDASAPDVTIQGIAVCPPIMKDASQAAILDHYRQVLAATRLPIAVYELPQVTQCSLAPATLAALKTDPRVVMFKDTSGTDVIAAAGAAQGVVALRGAEGRYAEFLKPRGPYDGWLLSTGNAFARQLRAIAQGMRAGDLDAAEAKSEALTTVVQDLFAAAAELLFGNAFSNANRAGDHVLAHGRSWRARRPPETFSGGEVPASLIDRAARGLETLGSLPEMGYLTP